MGTFKKIGSLVMVLALSTAMLIPSISLAAELPIDLGTASSFAILAGQTITNTGTTTINGNVGIAPGSSFTKGPAIINGMVHLNDAIAIKAKEDLIVAYNNAASRSPIITIPTELGGSTLKPGYYVSASGTFGLTGTLTLDAGGDSEAVFVFMTASSIVTASGSNVSLINGASDSQIFWQAGSSATLGINSHMEGTILAMESITLNTGATIEGALLARNGSVTLDSNTINTETLPLINIEKTADKTNLAAGPETVTYTYRVTNIGGGVLSNILVTDDKLSNVTYLSGDINEDQILQTTEAWLYTGSMNISITTTNVAIVTGVSNNEVVTATATATVTVTGTEGTTEATTETTEATEATTESTTDTTDEADLSTPPTSGVTPGGQLPDTATPLFIYLMSGTVLILMGLAGLNLKRRHEQN